VRASKAEHDESFATFMAGAGPAMLRTAWFLTGDTDRAQELTQAAFVKTYVVWHKIDHATALAYARRCLVNHKIDVWCATRHEVLANLTSTGFEHGAASHSWSQPWSRSESRSRDGAVATSDHRDDLVRRLSRLPEQQGKGRRPAVLRRPVRGCVAEALGISVGSVKSAASRGLAALRQHAETQSQAQSPTSSTEGSLR